MDYRQSLISNLAQLNLYRLNTSKQLEDYFTDLKMKSASRVTSFVSDQYFVIGSYFRSTGAIIPSFFLDLGGVTIGSLMIMS